MGARIFVTRRAIATLACLAAALGFATSAFAERVQDGNLIVTLNGEIAPRQLPRYHRAPVAVHLAGRVLTSDGSPVPRVNWIRLELAWRGVLDTRGLPVCPRARLEHRFSRQALDACRGALVGRGSLYSQVFLPNQRPFGARASVLAFNGRTRHGRPAVFLHAFTVSPPTSFVIPFVVRHKKGSFRTVLITTIRRSVGPWPHVANFQVEIARKFRYRGERRSYTSASCPVPKGFTAGFLSFARATYTFAGGKQLVTESVRSCRVRGSRTR